MKKTFMLLPAFIAFSVHILQAQDGSLDLTFNGTGKITSAIGSNDDFGSAVAIQADGKIVVAGYSYNGGNYDFAIMRYLSDGSVDNTFSGDGKTTISFFNGDEVATGVAIQNDGNIVVCGYTNNGSKNVFAVARLLSDGSPDINFSDDGKTTVSFGNGNDQCNGLAIASGGEIVLAGSTEVKGETDFAVARLLNKGVLDNTFSADGKQTTSIAQNDEALALIIQKNGRIVLAGVTTGIKTVIRAFALARYNTDGTPDITFSGDGKLSTIAGTYDSKATAITIQRDDKIVVAGYGSDINDNAEDYIVVRYNTDGTRDFSFSGNGIAKTPFTFYDAAFAVKMQTDGKIVVGGYTECLNCFAGDYGLVRYNTDGNLDITFGNNGYVITGFGAPILGNDGCAALAIQPDRKIVAVGYSINADLSKYNFSIARYNNGQAMSVSAGNAAAVSTVKVTGLQGYPNPATNILHIKGLNPSAPSAIAIADISGNILQQITVSGSEYNLAIQQLPAGVYNAIITQNGQITNLKFIKQ